MSDYSKGRIYKVLNTITDDVYVGSTCSPLTKRFYEHKKTIGKRNYEHNKFYCKMQELGFDNFYIELVENYPCSTREELRAREGEWIRKISTLNKLVAGRDSKGYYDDNAEMLREKSRTYRIQNPEKIKAQQKAYYDKNAEKRREQRKIYHWQNREKVLEYKRQYHAINNQQEREYRMNKYEEVGKLQVECECGCFVTKSNFTRHMTSKKHAELMKQKDNPQE